MLEKGVQVRPPDFALVQPTYSHMALKTLMDAGYVKHLVSQNCDGLHLRSGLDRAQLSELHGNCFIEFCPDCYEEYVRDFDVTEQSIFRKHTTGRFCKYCCSATSSSSSSSASTTTARTQTQLRDSIIHFGEKLRNGYPYNWENAREAIRKADLIICFGSSLKVLKHYACLWPKKKSTQLIIVNIQWTPKDKQATLKINGYCDQVMKLVFDYIQQHRDKKLKMSEYSLKSDPLLRMSIALEKSELKTTTKNFLRNQLQKNGHRSLSSSPNGKNQAAIKQEPTTSLNSWFTKSFKKSKTLNKLISNSNETKS